MREQKKRHWGCWIFGAVAALIVFGYVTFIGYSFFYFYGKIKKGEVVDLPQFSSQLTRSGKTGVTNTATTTSRKDIEQGAFPALGALATTAKLTIVEFGDFECPFSKESASVVRSLLAKYGDRVRFEYRHLPLTDIHPNAFASAVASECANEQGKFWQFYDKLYANQTALKTADLLRYSTESGLDTTQFRACLLGNRYDTKVSADASFARSIGLEGTPTFFFNGQMVEGAIPEQQFDAIIQKLLK